MISNVEISPSIHHLKWALILFSISLICHEIIFKIRFVSIICYVTSFQAIPFLLELRSVLDWVCTDTTLTLYHWLKMEDIYANIYVLKCYRESEKVRTVLPTVVHWSYWMNGSVV